MEQSDTKFKRLDSLDTLRGFDMMFIMGVAGLIAALCAIAPGTFSNWLASQMGHVEWNGLRHHDTIFPLFLFIAGMSFPYSYAKQQARGASRWAIYRKIIVRGLVLVLLGMIYNGLLGLHFAEARYPSVLGRIGLAWMFAALLYINLNWKARSLIAPVILVGYWLLLRTVTAPDVIGSAATPFGEGNLVGYIDRLLLPGSLCYGNFDPEGLLSTLPAIVTAMLGMFAGEFVRSGRCSGSRTALYLALSGIALLAIGLVWSLDMPINKMLWSSSFVCVVGSYSVLCFALFYYLIDVRGWKRWTLPFRVIGLNSITIYMLQRIVNMGGVADFFVGGAASYCSEQWAAVILSIGYVVVCWLVLYFLYRQKVFLKV